MTDVPGSEPRDERVDTNPDADLAEVLRDDALLDAIGSSRESGWAVLPEDDVTRLLAALHADASTYAANRTRPTDEPTPDAAVPVPSAATLARRRHARPRPGGRLAPRSAAAISAAAVAGVVLSIGGVAAAVTGNPLSPFQAVVSGLAPSSSVSDGQRNITTVMPRELASVRTAIREGDLDRARRTLTDARSQVETLEPGPDRVVALDVIEVLEERLEQAESSPAPSATTPATPAPSTSPTDGGTESPTPTPTPSTTATPTPTRSNTDAPTPSPSPARPG